jgi:hypothetical protein
MHRAARVVLLRKSTGRFHTLSLRPKMAAGIRIVDRPFPLLPLTRERSAGQPAAALPPAVANALNGSWISVDPLTRGLVQIAIDGLNVHPFGACHPNPCDWGIVEGKTFAARVDSQSVAAMTAQKVTTFSVTTIILTLEADGRLRVDSLTHFTDGSNRSDFHSVDYLAREHSLVRPAAAGSSSE